MKSLNKDVADLVQSPLGSASAPSISFVGDPNTGIYSPGADQLAISTGGTGRLFIDSSGRVGIGTTSPQYRLHLGPSTPGAGVGGQIGFGDVGGVASGRIDGYRVGGNFAGQLHFYTSTGGGTETRAVTIDEQQRVGIGTASPSQPLHIIGTTASALFEGSIQGGITIQKAGTLGINLVSDQAGTLIFYNLNGNNERARIDSSGRLLVGTASALGAAKLETLGNSFVSSAILARINSNDTNPTGFICAKDRAGAIVQSGDQLGAYVFRGYDGSNYVDAAFVRGEVDGTPGANDMPGRLVFSTTADGAAGPTERMRITSDAYLRLASGTGGIQFNGDTAAANALDDYEEGTWTPVIAGSTTAGTATYSTQIGYYTKVGRLVTVQAYLNWSGGTGAGNLLISSLPFALPVGNFYFPVAFGLVDGIALLANNYITGYANANSTYIIITQSPVGGGSYNNVSYDAAGHLMLSCFYYV